MMELSIIIVNYNVEQLVIECINSIYTFLSCTDFEIIVVDNNSVDGSIDRIRKKIPQVSTICNDYNAGFSEANNQGIKSAKGNHILLLNPDTYLFDDSLCKMINFLSGTKEMFLVAPKLLNVDKTLQHSAWKDKTLPVFLQEAFRVFGSAYPLEQYTEPQKVENVSGAAMLFPKRLIEQVGAFDSNLFWMEDFDFCYRIRENAIPVYYYPDAAIVHYGGQSSQKNMKTATSNLILSKLAFYKKHHSSFKVLLAILLTIIHITGYLIFLTFISPFSKHYRQKISPYIYTFKNFFIYLFTGRLQWQ